MRGMQTRVVTGCAVVGAGAGVDAGASVGSSAWEARAQPLVLAVRVRVWRGVLRVRVLGRKRGARLLGEVAG